MRGLHKTDIEVIMEEALEKEKIEVVEQYPIRTKHGYMLDFAIPELKIDIEADGEHYHKWIPRVKLSELEGTLKDKPRICPKCKSPYWDLEKKNKKKVVKK